MNELVKQDKELATSVESKAKTLSELLDLVESSDDDELLDGIRSFKIGIVRKSLEDIVTMYKARNIVQNSLMSKITDEIEVYPIHTQLDILAAIDKIMDRNISIMESILPKADSIQDFLAKKHGDVTLINNMNVDTTDRRNEVEKTMMIVETILAQAHSMAEQDKTSNKTTDIGDSSDKEDRKGA